MSTTGRSTNLMRATMWLLAAVALLGLGATFFVESSFNRRIAEVQPIERDARSETGWRLVGGPIALLNVPEAVYVTRGSPGVPPQIDASKIRGDGRVVPYEPIKSTIQTARWGCVVALLLMIVGQWALKRLVIAVPDEDAGS